MASTFVAMLIRYGCWIMRERRVVEETCIGSEYMNVVIKRGEIANDDGLLVGRHNHMSGCGI